MPHFECGAFNRSATSPGAGGGARPRGAGAFLAKGCEWDKPRPSGRPRVGGHREALAALRVAHAMSVLTCDAHVPMLGT
jgi:hypothetical protein